MKATEILWNISTSGQREREGWGSTFETMKVRTTNISKFQNCEY